MTICCSADNELFGLLSRAGLDPVRVSSPSEAILAAPPGSAVLLLAEGYPDERVRLDDGLWDTAKERGLRLYVEYPDRLPGVSLPEPRATEWERVVVASDAFGPALAARSILTVSDCRYLPAPADRPWLVAARVAGYSDAVYGIPGGAAPILFEMPERGALVAATRLSTFVSGRYGPAAAWPRVWDAILAWLEAGRSPAALDAPPRVRPSYGAHDPLPADAEPQALRRAAGWVFRSRLLLAPERAEEVRSLLLSGCECAPATDAPGGDGSLGMLEGYSAAIRHDGSQWQRLPIRADCQAETAMVLAMDADLHGTAASRGCSHNLLAHLYGASGLQGGARGNPRHPAYGLIAWGAVSPVWEVANYGDDNARVLLATMLASACLSSGAWDAPMLRALLANLRTTGRLGFRGDRIDMPDLESRGWRSYAESETVNPAPHYEAYLWACYLWAYRHTGHTPFLDAAEAGIRRTMAAYPEGWRFNDTSERAQMLLPLAWLLRLGDTPERRGWLFRVAGDLLAIQDACGALPERFHGANAGYYRIPRSNEEYGVTETPLIQQNGDPASDQLYTTGFALLGLREAAAATGEAGLRAAEDRLAGYLCRIQVSAPDLPSLDGSWFRAFDFRLWDYWSSSADAGWGAWCVEAGWGAAWTAAVLGLRQAETSLWDRTAGSGIGAHMASVQAEMALNDGSP